MKATFCCIPLEQKADAPQGSQPSDAKEQEPSPFFLQGLVGECRRQPDSEGEAEGEAVINAFKVHTA